MTNTPVSPVVEMLIGGVWTDITPDVRLNDADSGGGIRIKRGVPNEGNVAEPTEVDFVLNNREGKYSPRNPYSPNYGKLGRNTPVRVALSRQKDVFNRTEVDTWGRLPTWTNTEGRAVLGDRWTQLGGASRYDITPGNATIQSGSGYSIAQFGTYRDVDIQCKVKVSNRTSEFGVLFRSQDIRKDTGGDFESGLAGWVAAGGTLNTSTVQVHTGTTSALLTVSGSPVTSSLRSAQVSAFPGDTYRGRVWVRCSIATNVTATLQWLDSTGASAGTNTNVVAVAANTWTVIEVEANAPDSAAFVTYGPSITGSPANGTLLFLDDAELLNMSDTAYYSAYVTPGSPDVLQLGIYARNFQQAEPLALGSNVVAGDWYWFRFQSSGIRRRVKFWKDGEPEPARWMWRTHEVWAEHASGNRPPRVGQVGLFAKDGNALVTFAEVTVTVWRAHAEIQALPPKWDLSRQDRWVPIQARGILQRLGQGRKALESPVTLHLARYTTSRMWIPFERFDDTSGTAGNLIDNAPPAAIRDVASGSVPSSGVFAAPGLVGCVSVDQETSMINARVQPGSPTGRWSFLTFLRVPNQTAASALLYTVEATGTARYWRVWYVPNEAIRVDALDADGTVISTQVANMYFGSTIPQGSWVAANLYVFQSGGTVFWAWNFHKPGGAGFYTINNSFSGSAGGVLGVKSQGSATLVAAGGVQFAQWFHYPGDLPFVDQNFARAAYAYINEGSVARFQRLLEDAGLRPMTTGFASSSKIMGAQTQAKTLDLVQEAAEVDDAVLMEDRDDLLLNIRTRQSMWNQIPRTLHIDSGLVAEPLDPKPDDFGSRNDVTVSRPGGGQARSVQRTGPLNINPPESDPNGIGTYDEGPTLNFANDQQLLPAANWRRSKGTLEDARYPSITADLTHAAYQASPAETALTLALDSGDIIGVYNTEVEYRLNRQQVQGYSEFIDQYDHSVSFVGTPGQVRTVGIMSRTTRLATRYLATNGTFISGADTELSSIRTLPGRLWVQVKDSPGSFPFIIEASGVQLRVRATGRVLNQNPYFETGIAGYVADGPVTLYWDRYRDQYVSTPGSSTPGSLRMTATGGGNVGVVAAAAAQVPVAPSTDYQISGWLMGNVNVSPRLGIDWHDGSGAFISTSLTATLPIATPYTWKHLAETLTSPANAAFARVRTRCFQGATQIYWVDELRLMPVSSFAASPQILTVDQVPVNGVTKAIGSGSAITVVDPWRVAF